MKKTREEIEASLRKHLPEVQQSIKEAKTILKDYEEDFNESREGLKRLVTRTESAIDILMNLAEDSEHPRAFEVLSTLIKTCADLQTQLLNCSTQRQKIHDASDEVEKNENGNAVQNNFFVGSTAELQEMLRKNREAIDV